MPLKAVQQFILGTVLSNERTARETLHQVKEAGYDAIELCGFMIKPTPLVVKLMTKMAGMPVGGGGKLDWHALVKEAGLQVVSVHEDLGSIERNPDAVIAQAKAFGTKYTVITGMYRFTYGDADAVRALAARLNKAGEELLQGGVQLLYHNHNCEFIKTSADLSAYDLLLQETDPRSVNFEFDSYWAADAGANPLELMKKLGTRMKLYHINDRGTRVSGPVLTPILKSDSMELGTGSMDLPPLVQHAKAAGVDAIILESHRNWVEKSPVKSFQLSAKFMNQFV